MRFLSKHSCVAMLRWYGWFFLVNTMFFCVIGLYHFYTDASPANPAGMAILTSGNQIIAAIYKILSYITQYTLLAFIPSLILLPLIRLRCPRLLVFVAAVSIASMTATYILIDALIYNLYQFHLNGVMLELITNSIRHPLFGLSTGEMRFGALLICGIVLLECIYAFVVWRVVIIKNRMANLGKCTGASLLLSVLLSYGLMAVSLDYPLINAVFVDSGRYLPLYHESIVRMFPINTNEILLQGNHSSYVTPVLQSNLPLHYPVEPVITQSKQPLYNLVIIVIDSWRFDMQNQSVTPHINAFSRHAWNFKQHFSGGNATQPGIFSMFYGLPATYWYSMENEKRSPVLLKALLDNHYQMGIFSSASLKIPDFRHAIFAAIDGIDADTPGETAYDRDINITKEFEAFLSQRDRSKPFFSFLLYDAVHSYCGYNEDLGPLQPTVKECKRYLLNNDTDPVPYFNRYKNALLLVDKQIDKVIKQLEKDKLLDNTVVIITGDHGEEFNDNHINNWGHASNFTRYQIQTPLIVHWPKSGNRIYSHISTHYDLAPTLMAELLHITTPFNRYSMGQHLLSLNSRPYYIVGSYVNLGVVEPSRSTTINPDGRYRIAGLNGQPLEGESLNLPVIKSAMNDMNYFFRQNQPAKPADMITP